MSVHISLNNFTGGEVTPEVAARTDLQKYGTSCRTMFNYRPLPWGGAKYRASTIFAARCKYDDRETCLIPFKYSTTITYVIEMGDLYMRFYYGTGIQLAIAAADAIYWDSNSGYTLGVYVQWQGVVYHNILAVAIAVPPARNPYPYLDPTHWTATAAYEIASPYAQSEVFDVQYKEINDVVYLVHPAHPVYKLSRVTSSTFTLLPVAFRYPALLDENLVTTLTMALGATTGATTLTASAAYFNASMIGAYFEIRHLNDATSTTLDISGTAGTVTSSALDVVGNWSFYSSENWYGTLQVQRSTDAGATWRVAREFKSASNHNVGPVSGVEQPPLAGQPRTKLRINYTATGDPYGSPPWVGVVPNSYVKASANLEIENAYVSGLVQITGFTSSTVVNVTVINSAASTAATEFWSEGAWSTYRGFPRAIGLFEQRLVLAGTIYKPNTVWMSVSADFENFLLSDLDDGSITYQPASCEQNPTMWVASLYRGFMGTSGEEMAITSGQNDEALTPTNVTMRTQSGFGSNGVAPLVVGKSILFVDRQGRRLRELMEGNPYLEKGGPEPQDLTLLAEHLTEGGIKEMDVAKLPDQTVYATLKSGGGGRLLVMTYNKEQEVNAWARYATLGSFDSVACVYGDPQDRVFVVTTRNFPGGPRKSIEYFADELADKTTGMYGTDCGILVNQPSSTTVTGLEYLEGMTVTAVANGQICSLNQPGYPLLTVTGGQITLPIAATTIRVGLGYVGELKPMPIELNLANGTSQGRRKRISELAIRFKDTLGGIYGTGAVNAPSQNPQQFANEVDFRETYSNMDQSPPLFTGQKKVFWNGNNEDVIDLQISQYQPFPQTILGVFAKLEFLQG
jgi:hypothetical protein